MRRTQPLILAALLACVVARAQDPGTVLLRARNGVAPVSGAEVAGNGVLATTDARGEARVSLPAGEHELSIRRPGFAIAEVPVVVRPGEETAVTVQLQEVRLETEVVVVSATRSGRMVQDQPIRVDAVPEEEIEENLTIAPGNLSTLLNEMPGARVQVTSPALGGAGLRLQGLRGRYTQVLLDELPLYGGQPGDFDLLQTPPLDLGQVEVLKGARSALHGGGAVGGVVNLVSRLPGSEPEMLVSQTSLGGTDAVAFVPHALTGGRGLTLLAGAHRQDGRDRDGDGWADLPASWRAEARPRFFFNDGAGRSLLATVGATVEEREGGTLGGAVTPDGLPFRDRLHTERFDAGLVGRRLLAGGRLLTVRAALTGTWHDRTFGEDADRDLRGYALGEAALAGTDGGHTWAVGASLARDWYRSRTLPGFDFIRLTPALFAQDEVAVGTKVAVSGTARLDLDDLDRTIFSPLVAVLYRPGRGFNLRFSAGTGYAPGVPFTEDTAAVGLWRVVPPGELGPEHAATTSLDLGWADRGFEVNATVFASRIRDPLVFREAAGPPGLFEIAHASSPTRTGGAELLTRFTRGPMQAIATYTYLDAHEEDPAGGPRREVPLTPRHSGELAWILEEESRGRVGVELSYTGRQALEHDPYRAEGPSYVELSVLGEMRVGDMRVFVNAVNLTDVRQTDEDPLLLPARAPDGRWTTDVWAPLAGRTFNAGVRMEF